MPKTILCLLVGALLLTACGGPFAKVNGSKKFKSQWTAEITPFTGQKRHLELELWVSGNKFRVHQKEDASVAPGISAEIDTVESDFVYDGTTLWRFNEVSTPKNYQGETTKSEGVEKLEPLADQMVGVQFWKVPADLPVIEDGQETIAGVSCKRYKSTQRSALGIDMVFRFWVDDGRGVLIQRGVGQGTDSGGGNEAVLGTRFTCTKLDLAPTFQADDFKFEPGSRQVEPMPRPPFQAI